MVKQINSLKALSGLAADIAGQVRAGDVLLLYGDLGAGKTTFTKSLAEKLGVKETVASPTFTIMAEYEVHGHSHIKELVHADLYRFERVDKGTFLSLKEMWDNAKEQGRLVVIEWAERLEDAAPASAWHLKFRHGKKENVREIEIVSG